VKSFIRVALLSIVAAAVVVVAGCGGSGDSPVDIGTQTPAGSAPPAVAHLGCVAVADSSRTVPGL